ncbi:MAG: DMT family transporter [Spirochaetales bacterium]|nr:DMT family transporter [Spirochaetales bacterium]
MNKILYVTVVLIWGTTWLAISQQAGQVPPVAAVFHRFLTASLIMFIISLSKREIRWIGFRSAALAIVQGLCLYSFNFILFYKGVFYISGGLESLIFSTAVFLNTLGSRLFWNQRAPKGFIRAALLGLFGLMMILFDDLGLGSDSWKGMLYCLGGTTLFSLGNMLGIKLHREGVKPLCSGTYAMVGGTMVLALIMIMGNVPFALPLKAAYLLPLIHLALLGSVIAFTSYLTLVNRIGAQKTALITVATPVIASALAVCFEGESLSLFKGLGALLILLSNILGQRGRKTRKKERPGSLATSKQQ